MVHILVVVLALALWGALVMMGIDPALRGLYHPAIYSRALGAAVAFAVIAVVAAAGAVGKPRRAPTLSFRHLLPLAVAVALLPAAMAAGDPSPVGLQFVREPGVSPGGAAVQPPREVGGEARGQSSREARGETGWVDDDGGALRDAVGGLTSAEPSGNVDLGDTGPVIITTETFSETMDLLWDNPRRFAGRPVVMEGMVFRQNHWPQDLFVTARLSIWCCVDDAAVVGLLTELSRAASPPEGAWIRLRGTLATLDTFDTGQVTMEELPVVRDVTWEAVTEPDFPYVFPAGW